MKSLRLLFAYVCCLLATLMIAAEAPAFELKESPKAAFIYNGLKTDGGWLLALDDGRVELERELGWKIAYTENVAEAISEIKPAVELFIRRGFNIILGSTYGYSEAFKELAEKYPNVAFLNAAGVSNGPNLQSFFGRTYETAYLCGMVAGAMSKSGNLGMVAAHSLGLVNWEVNAYLLGARKMNPKATLRVIYTGEWSDPVKERNAALALVEAGVDVIGQAEVDTPAAQIAAQENGILSTGHHVDMSKVAPEATLCSSVWVWHRFLTPTLKNIVSGSWSPGEWGAFVGIKDGGTDITLSDNLVRQDVIDQVMAARQEIIDGKHVFAGPIKDQDGKVVVAAGETASDGDLWGMDYLVEGVIGSVK